MFIRLFSKYHIKFQKVNRFKVLGALPLLLLIEWFWKLKKKVKGASKPVIHLYAVCWNEAKLFPFVLEYYERFVDHFYIYDNYSNDETDEILKNKINVTVRKFDTGDTFNDLVHQKIKNTVWKQSRGKTDWVIVIDLDELIYQPRLLTLLTDKKSQVTIFKPTGYDMVSSDFPTNCTSIVEGVKYGVRKPNMDKCVLFNPHRIVDINYLPGAHECNPDGIVVYSTHMIKLLHYKYLGIDYVLNRINLYRKRLSKENIENEYGIEYLREMDVVREDFDNKIANCQLVID